MTIFETTKVCKLKMCNSSQPEPTVTQSDNPIGVSSSPESSERPLEPMKLIPERTPSKFLSETLQEMIHNSRIAFRSAYTEQRKKYNLPSKKTSISPFTIKRT